MITKKVFLILLFPLVPLIALAETLMNYSSTLRENLEEWKNIWRICSKEVK